MNERYDKRRPAGDRRGSIPSGQLNANRSDDKLRSAVGRWGASAFATSAFAAVVVLFAAGGDWVQFRTAGSNSVAEGVDPPLTWSATENVAWKAPLPGRGPASPIVVGDRVIVTASSGVSQDRLHVLAFDLGTGRQLWERQFWATGRTLTHPTSANAAPTPASDGEKIFAFYSSNDLICLDLQGALLWYRGLAHDFPHAGNDVGMASSPAAFSDAVVVQIECQGDSFAAGLDTTTGETRWKLPRNREAGWCSPVAVRGARREEDIVLLQSIRHLTAHEPRTGRELWRYESSCDAISSAAVDGGLVFVPSQGITAIRPVSGGEPEVLWTSSQLQPGAASPVVHEGRVYVVNRAGVLVSGAAATGEASWKVRLQGEFWGTPLFTGDRFYCINKDGVGTVVRPAEDGQSAEIVGGGEIGEMVQSSPVAVGRDLLIRSDQHLWKISSPR